MATAYASKTPPVEMLGHRHAWRQGPREFSVIARDGCRRYYVSVRDLIPLCNCPAGQYARPCYHAAVVLRRLQRELRPPCRVCGQWPCVCRDRVTAAFADALLAQQVAS